MKQRAQMLVLPGSKVGRHGTGEVLYMELLLTSLQLCDLWQDPISLPFPSLFIVRRS